MGEASGCAREEPTWSSRAAVTVEGQLTYTSLASTFNPESAWYFQLDSLGILRDVSSLLHLFNVPSVEDRYWKECHFMACVGLPAFAQILFLAWAHTFYSGEER